MYSPLNPPFKVTEGIDATSIWVYASPDSSSAVATANYFSDGGDRGMRVGDIVVVTETGTGRTTPHMVTNVATTYPNSPFAPVRGAVTISPARRPATRENSLSLAVTG